MWAMQSKQRAIIQHVWDSNQLHIKVWKQDIDNSLGMLLDKTRYILRRKKKLLFCKQKFTYFIIEKKRRTLYTNRTTFKSKVYEAYYFVNCHSIPVKISLLRKFYILIVQFCFVKNS